MKSETCTRQLIDYKHLYSLILKFVYDKDETLPYMPQAILKMIAAVPSATTT